MCFITLRACIPRENAPQSANLITCDLAVTLNFDLLTSKSKQFISVPNCTEDINLVKFAQDIVYVRTYARTVRQQNASVAVLTQSLSG